MLPFPQIMHFYSGKVRDVYVLPGDWIVLFASDRLSAFDVILPRTIPYKGQILNKISALFLKESAGVVPNWFADSPVPGISIGKACEPIRIEMVVRGCLSGHAWRLYKSGIRNICGNQIPEGMRENEQLPHPIITPTRKAESGHDTDISPEEIMAEKMMSASDFELMCDYALKLFDLGQQYARKRGLLLADTKYEFGFFHGQMMLMDEVHTPDSSRYFYLDQYEEHLNENKPQPQLSKEWVRQWLMQEGFSGEPGQTVPKLTDERVEAISNHYQHIYRLLTGEDFVPGTVPGNEDETVRLILQSIAAHKH